MYVVTGATGNTGKIISAALLAAGKKVRIVSRNPEKVKMFTEMGAELFTGDTSDAKLLKLAFNGAKAVYAMIPIDWQAADYLAHQVKHATAIAEALRMCKVPYVVSLSSLGAHMEKGSGVVLGLNRMETLLDEIEGLHTLHLRPGYFMENSLGMVGLIKQAGVMGSPIEPALSFPVIATKDIGNYAAKRLLSLDFKGHNHQNLLGPGDVTYQEMAKVYGQAIGKTDLNYVGFPYADFRHSLISQMGASEDVADRFVEFIEAMNDGRITAQAKRDAESTTPTTVEAFAPTFAYVYNL